jgi:hypothetical protein
LPLANPLLPPPHHTHVSDAADDDIDDFSDN